MASLYGQDYRLRFIEFTVGHFGFINRSHLAVYFGMSIVQASADINAYILQVPNNLIYDKTNKCYVRGEMFRWTYF